MVTEPKEIVRSFIEGYQEKRDPAVLKRFLAGDVVDHTPMPGMPTGVEGVRVIFEMLWAGLPDMRVQVHNQIAEGDMVATHKSFVGTHRGDLFGVAPTGRSVHLDLVDFVRISGGQIVEHWNVVDTAGLLRQLGALAS